MQDTNPTRNGESNGEQSRDPLEWARANRDRIRELANSDEPIADLCHRLDANLDAHEAGDNLGSVLYAPPSTAVLRQWAAEVLDGVMDLDERGG